MNIITEYINIMYCFFSVMHAWILSGKGGAVAWSESIGGAAAGSGEGRRLRFERARGGD